MAFTLTIAGNVRTFDVNGLNVRFKLANRSTMDVIMTGTDAIRPVVGNPIVLSDGGSNVFGGTIDEITETRFPATDHMQYRIRCVDYVLLLDKRTTGNLMVFGRIPVTVNTGTDTFTSAQPDHYLLNNDYVMFSSSGTLPGGIFAATVYYVINKTANTFQVSLTQGGSAVDVTGAGSGEILVHYTSGTVVKRIALIEGITAGTISPGNRVDSVTFNYTYISDAINQVTPDDYIWWISADKELYYVQRNTIAAPFNITSASPIWQVQVRNTREQYFNTVYVQGAPGPNFRSKNFTGDGTTKRWYLGDFDAVDTPSTIIVNSVEKSLGVLGDTGSDFYYTPQDRWLYQDSGAAAVPAGQPIVFTFYCVNFRTQDAEDLTEVSARAAIEGDSGIYEYIHNDDNLSSSAADEYAEKLLATHKVVSSEVSYETQSAGLEVGQIQTINIPEHGINGSFLIDEVHVSVRQGQVYYNITAIAGVRLQGWIGLFLRFLEGSSSGGSSVTLGGGSSGGGSGNITQSDTLVTADVTISLTPAVAYTLLLLIVRMDGTGGWTVTLNASDFHETPVFDNGVSKTNACLWYSDGTKWRRLTEVWRF